MFIYRAIRKLFKRFPSIKWPFVRLIQKSPMEYKWKVAQRLELEWHKKSNWRRSNNFLVHTEVLLSKWGYLPSDYAQNLIIDLGCGSRLRSKFFKNAKIIAIDPLAENFIKYVDYSDIRDAYRVYSLPAEKFILEIENKIDFIMCINVLDHSKNPKEILRNSEQ